MKLIDFDIIFLFFLDFSWQNPHLIRGKKKKIQSSLMIIIIIAQHLYISNLLSQCQDNMKDIPPKKKKKRQEKKTHHDTMNSWADGPSSQIFFFSFPIFSVMIRRPGKKKEKSEEETSNIKVEAPLHICIHIGTYIYPHDCQKDLLVRYKEHTTTTALPPSINKRKKKKSRHVFLFFCLCPIPF
jgi:hypothetical protein